MLVTLRIFFTYAGKPLKIFSLNTRLFATAFIGGCITIASCTDSGRQMVLTDEDISTLLVDTVSAYDTGGEMSMPDATAKLPVLWHGNYYTDFNDSNYVHWAEAKRIGLEPLSDTRSHLHTTRPLVRVASCPEYYLEPLTYSKPYLVPEAALLLRDIGARFNDVLARNGGARYRLRVTSVLRTPDGIRRLQRVNHNAIDSSVHQLGTTFDISYARFVPDSPTPAYSSGDLKQALAYVLDGLRSEGRCYVKHERVQPCFHITVRTTATETK